MKVYEVRLTNFHSSDGTNNSPRAASENGRALKCTHRSRSAAERCATKRGSNTECTCGCFVVVEADTAAPNYALNRRNGNTTASHAV